MRGESIKTITSLCKNWRENMKKNYKEKTIINKELLIPLQTQFESSTFFEIDFGISEKMFLQSFHLI